MAKVTEYEQEAGTSAAMKYKRPDEIFEKRVLQEWADRAWESFEDHAIPFGSVLEYTIHRSFDYEGTRYGGVKLQLYTTLGIRSGLYIFRVDATDKAGKPLQILAYDKDYEMLNYVSTTTKSLQTLLLLT